MQIPPVDRNPIQWTNTQGANLYSTGASGPAAIRPVHAVNAVESTDQLGEGITVTIKNPEGPTDKSVQDQRLDRSARPSRSRKKKTAAKEPIYKELIEHIPVHVARQRDGMGGSPGSPEELRPAKRNMLLVRNEPLEVRQPKVKRTGGL